MFIIYIKSWETIPLIWLLQLNEIGFFDVWIEHWALAEEMPAYTEFVYFMFILVQTKSTNTSDCLFLMAFKITK